MIFGTRPEIIKLSPVFEALRAKQRAEVSCIFSGQQADLAPGFLEEFKIPISHELGVMRHGQSLPSLMSKLMVAIEAQLAKDNPSAVVVQGDTSTALAAAMIANLNKIPVFHVEAGLRTFNPHSPFPEETNRCLIAKLASHHFAATPGNRDNLIAEGVPASAITVSGNPIVDIVLQTKGELASSPTVSTILSQVKTSKLIVLTAHRRENFDTLLSQYLGVLHHQLDLNPEFSIVVPVHPNPIAKDILTKNLVNHERVIAIEPLGYKDFLMLLRHANLIVSDSGGIQEEAISLGCPLFVLRETTERPEALACNSVRLAPSAQDLEKLLGEFVAEPNQFYVPDLDENPFGDGKAGPRIADYLMDKLENPEAER